jgi:transketolase
MKIIVPADDVETRQAIRAAAHIDGPVYLRLGRLGVPPIFDENHTFTFGKGNVLKDGKDITIIGMGLMISKCLKAAELLKQEGISARVINISTIKPIDEELIIQAAKETKRILTVEEHSVIGGLGSAVCDVLSTHYPVQVVKIGMNDTFGESGKPEELLTKYGLTAENIYDTAQKTVNSKK